MLNQFFRSVRRLSAGLLALTIVASGESRCLALQVNAGDIIVGNDGSGTVVKVDPLTGAQSLLAANLGGVHALALAPNGDLYILQHVRIVSRLNIATGFITNITRLGFLGDDTNDTFTAGMTLATNGDIYVSVYSYPYTGIVRVNPATGAQTLVAGGYPNGYLTGPIGLNFATGGELMIGDIYSSVIIGLNVTSGAQRLVATNIGPNAPWGLAVRADGTMFAGRTAQEGSKNVLRITSGGTVSVVASNGLLNSPYGIALESDSSLVVCQPGDDSIVRVSTTSTNQTLITSGNMIHGPLSLVVSKITVPAPLSISRATSKIQWPTNTARGLFLQSSTNLSNPVSWSTAAEPVSVVGSNYSVSVDLHTPAARYFRLQRSQ